jgi:hypothetical protein
MNDIDDDIEVTWHGEPPKKQEDKDAVEKVIHWLYYNRGGCFLFGVFILTPIVAVLIAIFS